MSLLRVLLIPLPISAIQKQNKLGQPNEDGCLAQNDWDDPNQMNALYVALIETKMGGDEQKAKMMLEWYQVLQACIYKANIAFGAEEVWMTSMVIMDTGPDSNLNREEFIMTT